jgi:C4-dicarboxylate transporter, DctM subunit
MTPLEVGIASFVVLALMIYFGVHVSTALLMTAFFGTWYLRGDASAAGTMLGIAATDAVTTYEFGVIPLFVLMGMLAMVSGIGRDSYLVAHRGLKRVPGGLAYATVAGNAIFASIIGVSIAAAVLFTKLAVPEMLKRGYHPRVAVGVVAGSSLLGMLIPPSILMVVYAILTEVSIGDMYAAGVIPGLLLASAYCVVIFVRARLNPQLFGQRESVSSEADLGAMSLLMRVLPIIALVIAVLGGLYGGVFTATEAAAVGAAGTLIIALARRSLTAKTFWKLLVDTGYVTASLILIIAAASMFSRFLAMSGLPSYLSNAVVDAHLSLGLILVVYVGIVFLLGCVLDSTSIILIMVPLFSVIFKDLGANMVWIGIITVIAVEVGLLTPPLGMSVFVVKASLEDRSITLRDVFMGALPFAAAAAATVLLIALFPRLATLMID